MDTTALVHACYVKFAHAQRLTPGDRSHFLSYAATVMRSIIVDAARASLAERRGGGAAHVTLNTEIGDAVAAPEGEILDVHDALGQLAQLDTRLDGRIRDYVDSGDFSGALNSTALVRTGGAIQALAPTCPHCGVRIVGHGVEEGGRIFCCAHCAKQEGATAVRDRG